MGDPVRLSRLMIAVAGSDNPPLYLVLGGDALEYVGVKRDAMAKELETHRADSLATAFDVGTKISRQPDILQMPEHGRETADVMPQPDMAGQADQRGGKGE